MCDHLTTPMQGAVMSASKLPATGSLRFPKRACRVVANEDISMPGPTRQIVEFFSEKRARQNVRALLKFLAFLTAIISVYSILFHLFMAYEGRAYSWITGVYWTLTTMTTVGYGDIVFESDLGRTFSIFVLSSGIVLFFIVLPFVFIRYLYAPWLEAQIRLRTPRSVPPKTRGT